MLIREGLNHWDKYNASRDTCQESIFFLKKRDMPYLLTNRFWLARMRGENGKKLVDYLLSPKTELELAFADCAQIPLHAGVETPDDVIQIEALRTMKIDFEAVAMKLQEIQPYLKEWVGY